MRRWRSWARSGSRRRQTGLSAEEMDEKNKKKKKERHGAFKEEVLSVMHRGGALWFARICVFLVRISFEFHYRVLVLVVLQG